MFRKNPSASVLSWLALLFAVLSVAVTAVDDSSPILYDLGRKPSSAENVSVLSSRYRSAAMQCLAADHYLWRHTIHTLQALILLIYGINHTHGQSWALLGTAYNIALALGCHIDPDAFDLGAVKREERRRCWAGLMMLHTIQNTTMGNLDQRSIESRVKMPADVNDDELISIHSDTERTGPTQMSYLLYKFRLYKLCSKVCEHIFGRIVPPYASIMALDAEISHEQSQWSTRYIADSQNGLVPTYQLVHLNILYGYSHQLFLLLHRPVFSTASPNAHPEEAKKSRSRCIDSASGLLNIHQMLQESSQFKPYRWYNEGLGSFHAFHASVVLYSALGTAESPEQFHDIKTSLVKSLSTFEEMAERSSICAKVAPVLRSLL